MWTDRRFIERCGIEHPIVQAPMAGANDERMALAVAGAGALGAMPCAMLSTEAIAAAVERFRAGSDAPLNLNFFCHRPPHRDTERASRWRARLAPYYAEFGLAPEAAATAPARRPFDEDSCALVEVLRPAVVSFHFGLPEGALLARVKTTGALVLSSATTVDEARWLQAHGCDAIIAQGLEAGGHRGHFLSDDLALQRGTLALVPQIVDAVDLPVIAAGGIGDGRGIAAAMLLGASAVQIGSAYLRSPQATITDLHRNALREAPAQPTTLTNLFSGRPARGLVNRVMRELGPMCDDAPAFPTAGAAMAALRAAAEARGSRDFSPLWAGEAAALARAEDAGTITRRLAREALAALGASAPGASTRS